MCDRCNPCPLRPLWLTESNKPHTCIKLFGDEYAIYKVEGGDEYLAVELDNKAKLNRRILGRQTTIDEVFKIIGADIVKKGNFLRYGVTI